MDTLREVALSTVGHRTDTSVEPFVGYRPVSSPSTSTSNALKKSRSQPLIIGVHPFSDYTTRSSLPSQPCSASHHVRPFTDYRLTPTTKFKIGKLTTPGPLVNVAEMKGHIALLDAFSELKKMVEASGINPFLTTPFQPLQDAKWTWFVGLAVERFDVWCRALKPGAIMEGEEKCLPPIDVLMVWHAYMLNPRWYAEDTMRILACKRLRMLELNFTSVLENPMILCKPPSDARMEHWRSLTALPFDPLKGIHIHTTRLLRCPSCQVENEVELGNQVGTGYMQQDFKASCRNPKCGAKDITKSTLAHRKLAWDVAASSSSNIENPESRLAGTAFPRSAAGNTMTWITDQRTEFSGTRSATRLDHELRCRAVMKYRNSMDSLRNQISHQNENSLVKRILSAYNDDKAYSVSLVEAVLHQAKFIEQISDLGWIRPDYFPHFKDESFLHRALARYHAVRRFLDLENSSPNIGCIPTLDIDLVWHTHQLMPTKYYTDMNLYLNHFLDHDVIETKTFSSRVAQTSRLWQGTFSTPYTHCGCAAPEKFISNRFSRLMNIRRKKDIWTAVLPHSISATHPSDHNVKDDVAA